MERWFKSKYVRSLIFTGVISFFVFAGYLIGLHKLTTYGFFRRVELNTFGYVFERMGVPEAPEYYDSIFLRLYSNQADVSDRIRKNGRGGGLTSFGDEALLLAHDGQIFVVHSKDDIRKTNIEVPDNGFDAYGHVAESEEFKHLQHNLSFFRYNDIQYYQTDSDRGFAISYTEFDSTTNCYRNTVAVLPLGSNIKSSEQLSAKGEDWDILFRAQPCLPFKSIHNALEGGLAGGRLAFRPPSTLFLGSGDYHWDGMYAPEAIAQNPTNEHGKIIAIDLNSRQHKIFSIGIRNPQGVALDKDGEVWIVEHGLRGGDELNHIKEGENYGWPVETLGTQYSKLPIPNTPIYGRHEKFKEPTYAWLPSVAISSLTLIDGFHESWDGDLLMGSLKSMSLFHTRIKNNRVLFAEKIEIGERIRYVHQHTDGQIILWTDSKKLIFLTGKPYTDNYVNDYLVEEISNESFRSKVKSTINSCRQCHSIDPDDHTNSPSLAQIFNAQIGATDFPNYSRAMKEKSGSWTPKNLKAFLRNPEIFTPGTVMPNPGINDDATLEEIVIFLEALNHKSPNPR